MKGLTTLVRYLTDPRTKIIVGELENDEPIPRIVKTYTKMTKDKPRRDRITRRVVYKTVENLRELGLLDDDYRTTPVYKFYQKVGLPLISVFEEIRKDPQKMEILNHSIGISYKDAMKLMRHLEVSKELLLGTNYHFGILEDLEKRLEK